LIRLPDVRSTAARDVREKRTLWKSTSRFFRRARGLRRAIFGPSATGVARSIEEESMLSI